MYMCEDYNSPQSPYWCMKTLISICLAQEDEFWTAEEQPYPSSLFKPNLVPGPRQILSNHPDANHHFLLSPAQFVSWPLKASQAKYSKFEYSSAFGFSVPTGPLIQQMAPDCTLALSRDGTETWAVKWKCAEATFPQVSLVQKKGIASLLAASVRWFPWRDRQVEVQTTLIPPTDRWPDWHVRVHRIRVHSPMRSLHAVEGGFAAQSRCVKDGSRLPALRGLSTDIDAGISEGIFKTEDSVLILSATGWSGVSAASLDGPRTWAPTSSLSLQPDSNTNLVQPRSLIPVITRDITRDIKSGEEFVFATNIFAVSATANGGRRSTTKSLVERWADQPKISIARPGLGSQETDCILLEP